MACIKNWHWFSTGFLFILLFFCLHPSICRAAGRIPEKPIGATNGVLDLSAIDFEKNDCVKLDGYWAFYWNRLLSPMDFSSSSPPLKTGCFYVPQSWTRYDGPDGRLESCGYATYRLTVILPEAGQAYALNLMYMATAYKMWIDGRPVPGNGIVGTSPAKARPQSLSRDITFTPRSKTCEIIVQVSNFSHIDAGIVRSLKLGRDRQIRRQSAFDKGIEVFVIGCTFSMSVYHFLLFLFRRKDISHFYFGLICFLISVRNLTIGVTLITQIFPDFSWEYLRKIMVLCLYFLPPAFAGFLSTVFPKEFSKRIFKPAVVISSGFALLTLFFPAKVFWHLIPVYDAAVLGFGLYALLSLLRAVNSRRNGAGYILLGFAVFLAGGFNEILYSEEIIHTGNVMPLCFLILILSQAVVLAMQSSQAYTRIENLVGVFEKFVPSRFLDRIAKQGIESIAIGNAEDDTIAVLFCDIRSFTTLSENMRPSQILSFLISFFSAMSVPIHKHHGFIDKFIGDAVMALFDANGKGLNHIAQNAVRAAVEMHIALEEFNAKADAALCPRLEMGIGIHIGRVVVGTVGTKDRMDSTVLGDAVNIASRLESLTKEKHEKIIVSSNIVDLLDTPHEFDLNCLGKLTVKGKTEPVVVYGVAHREPDRKKQTENIDN